jgi:hypothetical protein
LWLCHSKPFIRKFNQPHLHSSVYATLGKFPDGSGSPAGTPSQNFDSFVDRVDNINSEFAGRYRVYDFLLEHKVSDIGGRDEHTAAIHFLVRSAQIKETHQSSR